MKFYSVPDLDTTGLVLSKVCGILAPCCDYLSQGVLLSYTDPQLSFRGGKQSFGTAPSQSFLGECTLLCIMFLCLKLSPGDSCKSWTHAETMFYTQYFIDLNGWTHWKTFEPLLLVNLFKDFYFADGYFFPHLATNRSLHC